MNATAEVRDGRRESDLSEYESRASRLFVPLQISADHSFHGHVAAHVDLDGTNASENGAQGGGVALTDLRSDPHLVRRPPELISASDVDYYKLMLLERGQARVSQDGREVLLAEGDLVVYDTTRPYEIAFDRPQRVLVLTIPRHRLSLRPGEMAQTTARRIRGDGAAMVLAPMLSKLTSTGSPRSRRGGDFLAAGVLAVAEAVFVDVLEGVAEGDDARLGAARALIARIAAYIEMNLDEPGLSPRTIAGAHHISMRYLYKLFEAEGTTVSRWVRQARLERCRRDLADRGFDNRTVSAIAARWGFPDGAHFSRLFRREFGITPSEYRALCRETRGSAPAGRLTLQAHPGRVSL
jgi:AraC-like DNA-binding protein